MVTTLRETWVYPACGVVTVSLTAVVGLMWLRLRAIRYAREREQRRREEMEAYAGLDLSMVQASDLKSIGAHVCPVVAARSSFSRVAMLANGTDGKLSIVVTEGMDAPTRAILEEWLQRTHETSTGSAAEGRRGVRLGYYSEVVRLSGGSDRRISRAIFIPIRTEDRTLGALLVCADSILQVQRSMAEEAVAGLEALCIKLGREVARVAPDPQPTVAGETEEKLVYLRSDHFESCWTH